MTLGTAGAVAAWAAVVTLRAYRFPTRRGRDECPTRGRAATNVATRIFPPPGVTHPPPPTLPRNPSPSKAWGRATRWGRRPPSRRPHGKAAYDPRSRPTMEPPQVARAARTPRATPRRPPRAPRPHARPVRAAARARRAPAEPRAPPPAAREAAAASVRDLFLLERHEARLYTSSPRRRARLRQATRPPLLPLSRSTPTPRRRRPPRGGCSLLCARDDPPAPRPTSTPPPTARWPRPRCPRAIATSTASPAGSSPSSLTGATR